MGNGRRFPCAEEWIRCGAKQNRGCIWIYAWEAGKAGAGYFDLLSKEKTEQVKRTEKHMEDWYKIQLYRLIEVSKRAASKYTRSKVRKALPKDFAYVIEELITEKAELHDKESYYNEIIQTIIRIGRAEEFICAIADLIQRLVIDHLHIVGDIYDRGRARILSWIS